MSEDFVSKVRGKITAKTPQNRVFKLVVTAVCAVALIFLTRNIIKLFSVEDRLDSIKSKISEAERDNEELLKRSRGIDTDEFIEYEARSKLGYAKEGEVVVVLPPDDYLRSLVPKINDGKLEEDPNWLKWWKLLFYK